MKVIPCFLRKLLAITNIIKLCSFPVEWRLSLCIAIVFVRIRLCERAITVGKNVQKCYLFGSPSFLAWAFSSIQGLDSFCWTSLSLRRIWWWWRCQDEEVKGTRNNHKTRRASHSSIKGRRQKPINVCSYSRRKNDTERNDLLAFEGRFVLVLVQGLVANALQTQKTQRIFLFSAHFWNAIKDSVQN